MMTPINAPVQLQLPSWSEKTTIKHWSPTFPSILSYFLDACKEDGVDLRNTITVPGRRGWEARCEQILGNFITTAASKLVLRAPPDVVVGKSYDGDTSDSVYLNRWNLLPRNVYCNAYFHEFLRSDWDRHLHDHPWRSLSLCLAGTGVEHFRLNGGRIGRRTIEAGDVWYRPLNLSHRIELVDGPLLTIFITGPTMREWGFETEDGWVASTDIVEYTKNKELNIREIPVM